MSIDSIKVHPYTILAVLAALFVVVVLLRVWRRIRSGPLERGLPSFLRGATIAYQEKTFHSELLGLVARPDRVYRVKSRLHLVEFKTRAQDQVYESDVIELSVQGAVLADQTGDSVDAKATVVIQNAKTGKRTPKAVRLMNTKQVQHLRERYLALASEEGLRKAAPARYRRQCEKCGHLSRCRATFRDR